MFSLVYTTLGLNENLLKSLNLVFVQFLYLTSECNELVFIKKCENSPQYVKFITVR